MRAVWSFWSEPFRAHKGRIWLKPCHHLLAWGLSVRLARKHFDETMLVTDDAGAELIVEHLGLSFTHVSTALNELQPADVGWWALGKIMAYSMQETPFLHMDTDVFLWKPLPATLASAAVLTQCPEEHPPLPEWCGPGDVEYAFGKHAQALPVEWEYARSLSHTIFREENCGILGGTHIDFIHYYSTLAIDLVSNPAYRAAWAELGDKSGYMMLIEQFLLAACLDYHRFAPESPYRGIRGKHLFDSFGDAFNPAATARLGYTHLLGDAKGHAGIMARLERRVQAEDPEFYLRCMRVAGSAPLVLSG
jgi:hypothetical protein